MTALAGAFPTGALREWVRAKLQPGAVIKLRERMDDGQVHEKRFVVVAVSDSTICCVINSRIGPFIQSRPDMLRCQVLMPAAEFHFMDHDSHVDCSKTKTFPTERVVLDLMVRTEWILGTISADLRDHMVSAFKYSALLSPHDVALLCAALGAFRP